MKRKKNGRGFDEGKLVRKLAREEVPTTALRRNRVMESRREKLREKIERREMREF